MEWFYRQIPIESMRVSACGLFAPKFHEAFAESVARRFARKCAKTIRCIHPIGPG
jgi:hypothetical protein